MTRRRAYTMVEMMLAVSMTAVIVGTVTLLYAYTIERMGCGVADATTQREAAYGLDVIDATINKAQSCASVSVSGNVALKCTMPANCSDLNGDGILDSCTPDAINRRSQERWGNGYRVWFYLSDTTANSATPGSVLWMAKRTDDGVPTQADTVKSFTYFPGNSKIRLDLIQALTLNSGSMTNQMTAGLSVGMYSGQGGQAAPSSASTSGSYQYALTRTSYMRGWRL